MSVGFQISNMLKPVISYLGSTRDSIKIKWTTNDSIEQNQLSYKVQIEDRTYEWLTKYWGLKTETVIRNLGPEEIFNIRVGVSKKLDEENWSDEVWSDIFTSATKFDLPWSFYLFQDLDRTSVDNVVTYIRERSKALDVVNKYGETALIKGIRLKKDNAVKLLLNGGADVNQQSGPTLTTPLMIACYQGNISAAQLLTHRGANWSIKDRSGLEAIHFAVDNSQTEMVRFALECNASVDATDKFGWTPLMRGIILKCDPTILSILIDNGADVRHEDNHKRNCLHMVKLANDEVKKIFEKYKEEIAEDEVEKFSWKSEGSDSDKESEADIISEHHELLKSIIDDSEAFKEPAAFKEI